MRKVYKFGDLINPELVKCFQDNTLENVEELTKLADILMKLYFDRYQGSNDIIEFLDWLESGCVNEYEEHTQ